jgi:hypothetical protein
MKYILLMTFSLIVGSTSAQERVLKNPQPNLIQLTHFVVKLNPNDSNFPVFDTGSSKQMISDF